MPQSSVVGDAHIAVAWTKEGAPRLSVYSIDEAVEALKDKVSEIGERYYFDQLESTGAEYDEAVVDQLLTKIGVLK